MLGLCARFYMEPPKGSKLVSREQRSNRGSRLSWGPPVSFLHHRLESLLPWFIMLELQWFTCYPLGWVWWEFPVVLLDYTLLLYTSHVRRTIQLSSWTFCKRNLFSSCFQLFTTLFFFTLCESTKNRRTFLYCLTFGEIKITLLVLLDCSWNKVILSFFAKRDQMCHSKC